MYTDLLTSGQFRQEHQGHSSNPSAQIVLRPLHLSGHAGEEVAFNPAAEDLWLRQIASRSRLPWEQRLVEAIRLVAEELQRGSSLVEFIVSPSCWHPWVDYVIVRPLREGRSASLRVVSPGGTELSIYGWGTPSTEPDLPRRGRRRRAQRPARLYFDLAEVVQPTAPTHRDLVLYVTHRVREHYDAIEHV